MTAAECENDSDTGFFLADHRFDGVALDIKVKGFSARQTPTRAHKPRIMLKTPWEISLIHAAYPFPSRP